MSSLHPELTCDADGWHSGKELWGVAVYLDSLELLTRLSGLVDVLDVIYDEEEALVHVVVVRKSPCIFEGEGGLTANRLIEFKPGEQDMFTDLQASQSTLQVSRTCCGCGRD